MSAEQSASLQPRALATGTKRPHWRAVLEARWRARLEEVTELSLAYHHAAAASPDRLGGEPRARRLLGRAVAARRNLADTEEALGRLAAGHYGRCEQCGSPIGSALLIAVPETRYCPRCAAEPGMAATGGTSAPGGTGRATRSHPLAVAGQPCPAPAA
jgi:RNA polymerase-binding transcription factor DksA